MSHELRDRAFGLLSTLCANAGLAPDALRLASHTLVNLADDTDGDALGALADALPWLSALLELERGVATSVVASHLSGRRTLSALDEAAIARQLDVVENGRFSSVATDGRPRWQPALEELALLDQRLVELSMRSDRAIRNGVIGEIRLLRAVTEMVENGAQTAAAKRFAPLFPRWAAEGGKRRSDSLAVLEGLETRWDGGPKLTAMEGLGDRSLRFEISSTDHLSQSGYLVAVRAALAFAPMSDEPGDRILFEEFLSTFEVFREDPALASLASALASVRFKTLRHLRGAAPLSMLTTWVSYLRGSCAELAESRGLTLREATSFAHFCLHIMNFCDLAAFEPEAASDEVRRSMMDVEDELKEFALMGQRQGLSDLQANLARYDSVRWKSESSALRVADRIARLRGAWRFGLQPAPLGAPPRALESTTLPVEALMNEIDRRAGGAVAHLVQLMDPAEIRGFECLEALPPDALAAILVVGLVAARDLPGIDASRPFTLDLSLLQIWLSNEPRRATLLSRLLDTVDLEGLLMGEAQAPERGLQVVVGENSIRLNVQTTPELDALLTVLAAGGLDPFVVDSLTSHLERMIHGDDADTPWASSVGEEPAETL